MGKKEEEEATLRIAQFLSQRVGYIKRNKRLREIRQQQGFNLVTHSQQNLQKLRMHLQQTDKLLQTITDSGVVDVTELSSYEALKAPAYLFKEERRLFQLIMSNVTLKHSTAKIDICDTDTLKSVRSMIHQGGDISYSRTGHGLGRQAFVYFLTGVGDFTIDSGLDPLPVCSINLDRLAEHNREKYQQLYLSPHLAEFPEHVGSDPVMIGGTRIDMQFLDVSGDKKVVYRIIRESGEHLTLEFAINDLVYYGGDDIRLATAYHLILLLRLVGNPFRDQFLSKINGANLSDVEKISLISELSSALLPAVRLWETKAFDDLELSPAYTTLSNVSELNEDEELTEERFLGDISQQIKSLVLTHIDEPTPYAEEDVYDLLHIILNEVSFICQECFEGMPNSFSLPDRIQYVALKLVISHNEHATDLLKWFCQHFFSELDSPIGYGVNLCERKRTHRYDLTDALLQSVGRFNDASCIERLEILFAHTPANTLAVRMPYYISICAHQCFGKPINDSKLINYLLAQSVKIDLSSPQLLDWLKFPHNQRLITFLFEENGLNPNEIIEGKNWLEHAIDAAINTPVDRYSTWDKFETVNYLIAHGAKLSKALPADTIACLPDKIITALDIPISDASSSTKSKPKKSVVIIVTANDHDGATYVVVGRRINYSEDKLENFWAFPGGIIDEGETPEQAARREFKEETTLALDKYLLEVSELPELAIDEEDSEHGVTSIVPVHLHFQQTVLMPSVWEADDLYDVRAIRLDSCERAQNGLPLSYCGTTFRPSNALMLHQCLTSKQAALTKGIEEELVDKLALEANPSKYIKNTVRELIACRLSQIYLDQENPFEAVMSKDIQRMIAKASKTSFEQIERSLSKKLRFAIFTGIDYQNLSSYEHEEMFTMLVNNGDMSLLEAFLEKTGFILSETRCYPFDLYALYATGQWHMLNFILEKMPRAIFYIKPSIKDFKLNEEAPSEIQKAFLTHGLREKILDLSIIAIKNLEANQHAPAKKIIGEIKQLITTHPDITATFTGDDFVHLLLLQDKSLFNVQVIKDFVAARGPGAVLYGRDFEVESDDGIQEIRVFDRIFKQQYTNVLRAIYKESPYSWPTEYPEPTLDERELPPKNLP